MIDSNNWVALIIPTLAIGGGAERVVADFGEALEQEGFSVTTIVFSQSPQEYTTFGAYKNLWLRRNLGFFGKLFVGLSAAKKIANIARGSSIKNMVSHLEEANFVTILSKILFRNPASITIYIHQPLIAIPLWYRFVARILYPFADKIIALCDEGKKELVEQYHLDSGKIVLRPNTINIAHIQKLSHENLENPADEKIFTSGKKIYLTAGRLVPQKNHQFLVQAFDTFHQKHPDSLLCILGEWPLREELLQKIHSVSSRQDIYLLGNRINPFPYYKRAQAFVFSSTSEWWSLAIMEAMACKLPIISTIFPTGIRELLEVGAETHSPYRTKYGWLVKQNDITGFSQSLEQLHQNDLLRKEFSLNVQKRVSDFDSSCSLVPFSQLLPKSICPPQRIGLHFLAKISAVLLFILMAFAIFPPYPAWYLFLLDDPIFYSRVAGNWMHAFEYSIFPLSGIFRVLTEFFNPWLIQRGIYWSALFFLWFGVYQLVSKQSRIGGILAGIFAILTPFTIEHLFYGQVYVLWGIVAGTWVFVHILRYLETKRIRHAIFAWIAFGVAIMWTPHAIFLLGVPLGILSILEWIRARFSLHSLGIFFGIPTVGLALNSFWIYGNVFASGLTRRAVDSIGQDQLTAFATVPWDFGVYANVGLLGWFWQEPGNTVALRYLDSPYWPIFASILASFILLGIITRLYSFRKNPWGFDVAILLSSIVAYILAIGISGNTIISGISYFLYDHLPFYSGMREPQKWVWILLIGYAYFGGLGVAWVVEKSKQIRKKWAYPMMVAILLLLWMGQVVMSAWAFNFFHLHTYPEDFPQAWYKTDALLASRLLSGGHASYSSDCESARTNQTSRCYDVLFLPWHQYISFYFHNRPMLNPAMTFFFRYNILQWDNFEVSEKLYSRNFLPESKLIENYVRKDGLFQEKIQLSKKEVEAFIKTLRSLGIRAIVLADPIAWPTERWWMNSLKQYGYTTETFINSDMTIYWITENSVKE